MRREIVLLWFIHTLFLTTLLAGQKEHSNIIENQQEDRIAAQTILLSPKEFTEPVLVALSKERLSQYQDVDLLQVRFVTDSSAAHELSGKGIVHISYDTWRHEFGLRKRKGHLKVAELLKIGPNATLRISFPDSVKEISLMGNNAFRRGVQGMVLELLHTAIVRQGFGKSKRLKAILYYRVNKEISSIEAMTIARSISLQSDSPRLRILIRQDEWYIFDPYYPWFNPFTNVQQAPAEEELARSQEFVCESVSEGGCYQSSSGLK
jgi:hypothetical protein